MKDIAVLMTVFNRREKTLQSIHSLFIQNGLDIEYRLTIYLTDDGSTDGTAEVLRSIFPEVIIIKGSGNLFWNQGMRLAWKTALSKRDYDFYIWLNNDTYIFQNALIDLFDVFEEYFKLTNNESIVVASCCEDVQRKEFSYGLRDNELIVLPNNSLQKGNMMNGNFVLISKSTFEKLGNLSPNYTHAMGDHDYGLRANELGIDIITSKNYLAVCATNKGLPNWCDPEFSLIQRWRYLHSPIGLNLREYKIFRRRFWKNNYSRHILKIYLRCFFPTLINELRK
jgi:GT2 family glycosyltransferase